MKVSINGEVHDENNARIAPNDRGFTLGDGLFETMAVKKGAARRLASHLARLRAGAKVLGIPVPVSDARLGEWIAALIGANSVETGSLRLTLTRGPGVRGIAPPDHPTPTVVITTGGAAPASPVKLMIARGTRRNEHSPLASIKSLNYLDNILARQEAAAAGADDAVLLNTAGRVAETAVANIFLLMGGGLVTPPVSDGVLPGIMRGEIIALARAEERAVTTDDLATAGEIFLSNALGIRAATHVDGRPVGDGEPGLITQLLAARV